MTALPAALQKVDSRRAGVYTSIGLHLLVVAFIAVTFSNPQPLAPPVDLSDAIPISMANFLPKPPPPKPKVKPKTPKEVVTTKSPDAIVQAVEEEAEEAPSEQPQESSSSASGPASYASLVAGILQRNKRYPRQALSNGDEGVVEAYFVVNRQGHVIGYRLERRSGVPVLDAEVISLLKRVSFPPIPDDGGDPERREFLVPLEFTIRS